MAIHVTGVMAMHAKEVGPMTGRLVAGVDLGSTGVKLLVADEYGEELVVAEVPTPWRAGAGGVADLPVERLLQAWTHY